MEMRKKKSRKMFSFLLIIFILFLFGGIWFGSLATGSQKNGIWEKIPTAIASSEEREVRIFLQEQVFGFYEKGNLVFSGRVCSGRKGKETPRGKFRVLGKNKNYFSKKYQCAMPFAIRFTDQGHFLHQGIIFPWPSSHGCVRLHGEDAKKLFSLLKVKDAVIITD